MIKRHLTNQLKKAGKQFPIVGVFGPRQSGKTTLAKATFSDYGYVNLEDLEIRRFAKEDPKSFLEKYSGKVIIDEVQHVPDLFSYLQVVVDEKKQKGQFVLTGSQHCLMMESVSQSLAGRIGLLYLLPLSLDEAQTTKKFEQWQEYSFHGTYPQLYDGTTERSLWYQSYIQTYIERDVRQLKQVNDLSQFQLFLKLCAGRAGHVLNLSELAKDAGITHNTSKAWISVLEASFIVFRQKPHFRNFNKRLIKSPKLYFYDTGLLTWLLDIEDTTQLTTHFAVGQIFENLIISEYYKYAINNNHPAEIYYWRDKRGHEIDLVTDSADKLNLVELKSGKTFNSNYLDNIRYLESITNHLDKKFVIYGGNEGQSRGNVSIEPWIKMKKVFQVI